MSNAAGSFLSSFAGGFQTGRELKQEDEKNSAGASGAGRGVKEGGGANGDSVASYSGGDRTQGRSVMGGDYAGFNASLSNTESGGNYSARNSEGYSGKYQFGQARLDDYNNANGTQYNTDQLLKDPMLQESVQNWHVADIDKYVSSNGLDRYIGQNVGGVTITQDGLRAMAHLGGKGGMAKYLSTGGGYNPADSNGTHLSDYASTHAGASTGQRPQQPTQTAQATPQQSTAPQERGILSIGKSIVQQFYK